MYFRFDEVPIKLEPDDRQNRLRDKSLSGFNSKIFWETKIVFVTLPRIFGLTSLSPPTRQRLSGRLDFD